MSLLVTWQDGLHLFWVSLFEELQQALLVTIQTIFCASDTELCCFRCSDLTYADNLPNNDGNKCVLVASTLHRS